MIFNSYFQRQAFQAPWWFGLYFVAQKNVKNRLSQQFSNCPKKFCSVRRTSEKAIQMEISKPYFSEQNMQPAREYWAHKEEKLANEPDRFSKPNFQPLEFVERDEPLSRLKNIIQDKILPTYPDGQNRMIFVHLVTGSGMGKSRFAAEALDRISAVNPKNTAKMEELLQPSRNISVWCDFNGRGDAITEEEKDLTADQIIALRLGSRGLLGIPTQKFLRRFPDSLEKAAFQTDLVLTFIVERHRKLNNVSSNQEILFYLHLDELILANDQYKQRRAKDIVNTLGEAISEISKKLLTHFVVLITANSETGYEWNLTRFTKRDLSLTPLSVDGSVSILKKRFGNSYLLEQDGFRRLLGYIGAIPRLLEWLIEIIERKQENQQLWTNSSNPFTAVGILYSDLNDKVQDIYLVGGFIELIGTSNLIRWLQIIVFQESVTLQTKLGDQTLEQLSKSGHMYYKPMGNGTITLFFPEILLHLIPSFILKENYGKWSTGELHCLQILRDLVLFDLSWQNFELRVARMIQLRLSLLGALRIPTCELKDLLGLKISKKYCDKTLLVPELPELYKDERQWESESARMSYKKFGQEEDTEESKSKKQKSEDVADGLQDPGVYILAKGTAAWDVRLVLSRQDSKNPLILAIQTKFSVRKNSTHDTSFEEWAKTLQGFKSGSQRFIRGFVIGNHKFDEYFEKGEIIIVDRESLTKFFPPCLACQLVVQDIKSLK